MPIPTPFCVVCRIDLSALYWRLQAGRCVRDIKYNTSNHLLCRITAYYSRAHPSHMNQTQKWRKHFLCHFSFFKMSNVCLIYVLLISFFLDEHTGKLFLWGEKFSIFTQACIQLSSFNSWCDRFSVTLCFLGNSGVVCVQYHCSARPSSSVSD